MDHPGNLVVGANLMTVAVEKTADTSPVAGARVGVVQNGVLIGHGMTGVDGTVDLTLTGVATGSDIAVTVSEAGVQPYEGVITTGTAGGFLAASSLDIDDSSGNGDTRRQPRRGPGSVPDDPQLRQLHAPGLHREYLQCLRACHQRWQLGGIARNPRGRRSGRSTPLGLTIDADAQEGSLITLTLDAAGAGNVHNYSAVELVVAAPMWGEAYLAAADEFRLRSPAR